MVAIVVSTAVVSVVRILVVSMLFVEFIVVVAIVVAFAGEVYKKSFKNYLKIEIVYKVRKL